MNADLFRNAAGIDVEEDSEAGKAIARRSNLAVGFNNPYLTVATDCEMFNCNGFEVDNGRVRRPYRAVCGWYTAAAQLDPRRAARCAIESWPGDGVGVLKRHRTRRIDPRCAAFIGLVRVNMKVGTAGGSGIAGQTKEISLIHDGAL